jgi:2-polyprenyl-3-methyl-5-hydroxy-6-metoxy-1,4-benzoquinol methylase
VTNQTLDFDELQRKVAARYRPAGRFAFHYVRGKLRRDPVARTLIELATTHDFGDVTDVGCGRGQFAACLLEAGLARSVTGLECQAAHLRQARLAMPDLRFTGSDQDLSQNAALPAADTILLIDVLYQLDTASQEALLRRAASSARRGVIIRTADPARGVRSAMTRILELAFRRVWPHAGAHVNARPTGDVVRILTDLGLACTVVPCWAGTPFSNVLIVGWRAGKEGVLSGI